MTATTLSELVAAHARSRPAAIAFVDASTGDQLTWHDYNVRADVAAAVLAARHPQGARVAIHMPDGPDVHVAMLACERAGVIGVGIGPRAGASEVEHLVQRTGAVALIRTLAELAELEDAGDAAGEPLAVPAPDRAIACDEPWFLNSTSGTTGLPKCVLHNQARWFAFHDLAVDAGNLSEHDVCMSLLPAPFGFGLWTGHFTPTILGAPCVLLSRFDAADAIRAIERHRVTVLAAVSTQFVMMLGSPAFADHDLTSLRVMFTGGEMVPPEHAARWERETGSFVLQFYGSNETGALSATTVRDSERVRRTTAGHVLESMHVRLLDPDTGADVTGGGGPGVAACKGPVNCLGYYDDPEGNADLYTADGWMRTGDLCTIDADRVLRVVGRTSDFVIRGGKNLSAAVIEQECATMPGVLLAAAVAKPDAVFGERVCVFCAVAPGVAFTLDSLRAHLEARGVGKELWPEFLVLVEGDLPRSSGGKVAKAELRRAPPHSTPDERPGLGSEVERGAALDAGAPQRLGLRPHEQVAGCDADALGHRGGRTLELRARHDLVHETHRERFVRINSPPGEAQLARDRAADEIVQGPVHHVAERVLGMREPHRVGGDPQIAHHREIHPARDRRTVEHRDRGQRELEHRAVIAVARRPQRAREGFVGGGLLELAQVESGTEDVAAAGEHHARHRLVDGEPVERVADGVAQPDRECVLALRPVEHERRHRVVPFDGQALSHGSPHLLQQLLESFHRHVATEAAGMPGLVGGARDSWDLVAAGADVPQPAGQSEPGDERARRPSTPPTILETRATASGDRLARNSITGGSVMPDVTPCGTCHRAPIWCPNVCDRYTCTFTTPAIDIHAASWQSSRASRSSGAALVAGSAATRRCSASRASVSVNGCARGPHTVSHA